MTPYPFLPTALEVRAFLPELLLGVAIAGVMVVPMARRHRGVLDAGDRFGSGHVGLLVGLVAFLCLCVALCGLLALGGFVPQVGIVFWNGFPGNFYFGRMLLMDPFAWMYKCLLYGSVLIVTALWMLEGGNKDAVPNIKLQGMFTLEATERKGAGEFFVLLLSSTMGLSLLGSTTHLLMIFLALELAALPTYLLTAWENNRSAIHGALKHILFGMVCSAVMLYGMSLLYGVSGSMELGEIARFAQRNGNGNGGVGIAAVGLALLLVGVACKIGCVPAHLWKPDILDSSRFDVAIFLSLACPAGGLILLLRIVAAFMTAGQSASGFGPMQASVFWWLAPAVLLLGAASCFAGNLAALLQNNIKRMLAYSTLAHIGLMLIAVAILVTPGDRVREPAAETLLFYLFGFLFMNGGAFVAAAVIARVTDGHTFANYHGLSRKNPWLAAGMAVFLLSLAGVPLTVGFTVKLKLLQMLYAADNPWTWYVGIPVVAVNTILAAVYYLRIVALMYMTDTPESEDHKRAGREEKTTAISIAAVGPASLVLIAALALFNIALFFSYGWMNHQAQTFAQVHESAVAAPLPEGK